MDAREADLEPGQEWTGWHRIEKDLWPARAEPYDRAHRRGSAPSTPTPCSPTPGRSTAASPSSTFTVDQIANGSRGLLEEVATGKVTGEEEYWSRTDLWDFQANVDGAEAGLRGARAAARAATTPRSRRTSTSGSPRCRRCSTRSATATASSPTTSCPPPQVKQLADAVNALSEPLSHLTAAVVS